MSINTPCIGICSTVYGDEVCRGCKRRFKEVIDWNNLDSDYQDLIWARLNSQAEIALNHKIKIINLDLFNFSLSQYHVIKTPKHKDAFLILLLLRQAALEIQNLAELGLGVELGVNLDLDILNKSPGQWMKELDDEFYQLADA